MNSASEAERIIDGKYRIESQLGKGGMGTVFLATHIGTGRPVAVKVIAQQYMQRREFVERFRREAKAAGRLRHPNVVDVTDFGFSTDESGFRTAYLVMEYLDGCTLGEVLQEENSLPLEFTVDILEQVCSAVSEAHRQGIIHRDLKPDNIWLEPNLRGGYTVKVLDFGIAKLEDAGSMIAIPEMLSNSAVETVVEQKNKTSVDGAETGLGDEELISTAISESVTIATSEESRTGDFSEAGTVVQHPTDGESSGDSSEAGTMQFESKPDEDAAADPDSKRTRLIGKNDPTDDSADEKNTADLTRAGAVLGTPLYMSPEQCRGDKLTPASDIYSLSVIAYQMLSGKLPFKGDYVEVMNGHKNDAPPLLKVRKVSNRLSGVVMGSLSKTPEERPDSAEAFASKLRANSEGLGVLLRRAVVIYSERLPKFLLLALLTFAPVVFLTFLRVGINVMYGVGLIESSVIQQVNSAGLGILSFFVQVVVAALLVGMTTWVVGQVLAYPLRPISIRAAWKEVAKRWKPLAWTVALSTLASLIGFAIGAVAGILGGAILTYVLYLLFATPGMIIGLVVSATVGFFGVGTVLSAILMLVAPSIMMEGVSGRAAFRRSFELTRRSFRTVYATALLVYVVPGILAGVIGFSVGAALKNFELQDEMARMKKEGVVAQTEDTEQKAPEVSFSINGTPVNTANAGKPGQKREKDMAQEFRNSLREGIFELVWTPLALLITSFTAVITSLIYFKTRQAGGESMQDLLSKLDNADQPQTKWQKRVRERLIQSGKVSEGQTDSLR